MAAHFMGATADLSKRCQKPVYHLILSWDACDKPEPEAMSSIADSVLTQIGLGEHEAIYVAHQDRDHPHLHIMANRVSAETGKAWDKSYDYRAIRNVLREKEIEFGFKQVEARSDKSRAPSRAEMAIANREGRPAGRRLSKSASKRLKERLADTFRGVESWEDLDHRLAIKRYELAVAGGGIRVVRDGLYAKLSDLLPPKLTAKRLHQKLGDFKACRKSKERKRLERQQVLTKIRDRQAIERDID